MTKEEDPIRQYIVRVVRKPGPHSTVTSTDFVAVRAATDVEAAELALVRTTLRIQGHLVACDEANGPDFRPLEMPTGPIERPPWKPIPPEQWEVRLPFDHPDPRAAPIYPHESPRG